MILKSVNRPLWPKSLLAGVTQLGLIFTTHSMSRETSKLISLNWIKTFITFKYLHNITLINIEYMKDTVYVSEKK